MAKKRIPKKRAKRVRRRLRMDQLNTPVKVTGELNFSGDPTIKTLSPNLHSAERLNLVNCVNLNKLPANLRVDELDISGCTSLRKLPGKLHVRRLRARNSGLRGMATNVRVSEHFDLSGSVHLKRLAHKMTVQYLILEGCTSLERLPDKLSVSHLNLTNCTRFNTWGEDGHIIDLPKKHANRSRWLNRNGERAVILNNCRRVTTLPAWIRSLNYLDVRNCTNLHTLPDTLRYVQHLEIGESGLKRRPPKLNYERLYWNNVEINERIAWQPDKLTVGDVWDEKNLEIRRVMIERMGYNRFFQEANADLLDIDEDAGGERQLLRVELPERGNVWTIEEPIVCLAVSCPSTGHRYLLRVPPFIGSCHAGAAWLAGFDDPSLYKPLKEA